MQLTAEGRDGGTGEPDSEILDAMTELAAGLTAVTGQVAHDCGLPEFCLRALLELAKPTTMGDLGRRMRCDPSFVTITADILEKRGLARRESSTSDRRVKNLVLTPQGTAAREQAHRDLLAGMPWLRLSEGERAGLLALARTMIRAQREQADTAAHHRRAPG